MGSIHDAGRKDFLIEAQSSRNTQAGTIRRAEKTYGRSSSPDSVLVGKGSALSFLARRGDYGDERCDK